MHDVDAIASSEPDPEATVLTAIDRHSTILHVPQHQLRRARYLVLEESRLRATRRRVRYPAEVARDVGPTLHLKGSGRRPSPTDPVPVASTMT